MPKFNARKLLKKTNSVRVRIKKKFPDYVSAKASRTEHSIEMAKFARIKKSDVVLDPFGGAGFSSLVLGYSKPAELIVQDFLYSDKTQPSPNDLEKIWGKSAHSKKKRTKAVAVAANAKQIPLKDSSVDKIVTCPPYNYKFRNRIKAESVLESVMPELRRVLKNHGLLVIKVPSFWRLNFMPFHSFKLIEQKTLSEKHRLAVFELKKNS